MWIAIANKDHPPRLEYPPLRTVRFSEASLFSEAIRATFERCRTPLPVGMLLGLDDQFARDKVKQAQWNAFLAKNRLQGPPPGSHGA